MPVAHNNALNWTSENKRSLWQRATLFHIAVVHPHARTPSAYQTGFREFSPSTIGWRVVVFEIIWATYNTSERKIWGNAPWLYLHTPHVFPFFIVLSYEPMCVTKCVPKCSVQHPHRICLMSSYTNAKRYKWEKNERQQFIVHGNFQFVRQFENL